MKLIATLALTSLLAAGSAFAADATAPAAKPTSTAAHPDHHCRDDANAKKLAGAARKSFVKKCMADSKAAN
ncbi:MAG TPA: PsiF family protein [Steroidobacteraceae bacterium]|nr:PsiF family protein [Steroidobacteraceae bacterium]